MKGNLQAIPLILIAVIGVSIAAIVGTLVLQEVKNATNDDQIKQESLSDGLAALSVFDAGIVLVNASFYLASAILVYRIPSNPLFAPPALISLGISVWFSSAVGDVYGLFARSGPVESVANQFTVTTAFFQNIELITAGLGMTVLILLFGKTRSGSEVSV